MINVFLVVTLGFSWASNKTQDLNIIYSECMSKVSALKSSGKLNRKINNKDYCDCVRRNMGQEFSTKNDLIHLNVIARHEQGRNVEDELDELEAGYVSMDLFLDIRKECAENTNANKNPKKKKKKK